MLTGGKNYRQHSPLKEFVKARDNYTCQLCGSQERLEVDHIIPFAISHDSTLPNLRTLCVTCNRATRRKRKDARLSHDEYMAWLRHEIAVCSPSV